MATERAIAAVSDTIRAILDAARASSGSGSVTVALYQGSDFASPMTEGVSVHLYRVSIHGARRNLPPRVLPTGEHFQPSLPLELHYLVTAWGRTATRQHELLGWAIRTLEDHPSLPSSVLNQGQPIFADHESVELLATPLTPAEMVAVWEFNKAATQPSMTYVARAVLLDSATRLTPPGRVQARGATTGRSAT